jgi:hypothetical protein
MGEIVSHESSTCITDSDWSGEYKSVKACTSSNGTVTTTTYENGQETVVVSGSAATVTR